MGAAGYRRGKMEKRSIIGYVGFFACFIYFIVTIGFIITKESTFLMGMELVTILSTPIFLALFAVMPIKNSAKKCIGRDLSLIFMSCCMVLTSVAHFVNLTVTQPLIKSGVFVPTYLQIGQWPSVEMAVDYLAWGFFMGLAFLSSSFTVSKENKRLKTLKNTLLLSGLLCLLGILGVTLINENCWYLAPIGYGFGTLVVCIELILLERKSKGHEHNSQSN